MVNEVGWVGGGLNVVVDVARWLWWMRCWWMWYVGWVVDEAGRVGWWIRNGE